MKKVFLTARIDSNLVKELKFFLLEHGLSYNEWLETAIKKQLVNHEKKDAKNDENRNFREYA